MFKYREPIRLRLSSTVLVFHAMMVFPLPVKMKPHHKTRRPLSQLFTGSDLEKLLDLHAMLRDYSKHEDDLINQRSYWHLLIQGFLFATFGVMGEWLTNNFLDQDRFSLLGVLAGTGLAIAITVFCSIAAADVSYFLLARKWTKVHDEFEVPEKLWNLLPKIGGAGSLTAVILGMIPSLLIPVIISVSWISILRYAITERPADASGVIVRTVKPPVPPPTGSVPQPSPASHAKKTHHISKVCPAVPAGANKASSTAASPPQVN